MNISSNLELIVTCIAMVDGLVIERQKDINVLSDMGLPESEIAGDRKVLEKNIRFLRSLSVMLEAFRHGNGGSKIGVYRSKRLVMNIHIQEVMNFINKHNKVTLGQLTDMFLLQISDMELNQIIGALVSSNFIHKPIMVDGDLTIEYKEVKYYDTRNT